MRRPVLALTAAALLAGCPSLSGRPSLSLMSRADVRGLFEPVAGRVERAECFHNVLLLGFAGNAAPTHAGAIDRLLDDYDAEVLLDAELETEVWPFVLYNRVCARVSGLPARRVRRAR